MRPYPLLLLALLACSDDEPATTAGSGGAGGDLICFADLDGDGYIAESCGGTDTCDDDERVHPEQEGYFETESACGGYDFNGDGFEEAQWTAAVECDSSPNGCETVVEGWSFPDIVPKCGTEHYWGCTTADNGTSCQGPISTTPKRVQRCR